MNVILWILLALVLVCAVLFLILRSQIKAKKKADAEIARLTSAYKEVSEQAKALAKAQKENTKITEEANEKRRELNSASDGDLADRANNLFGGMQDNKHDKPNGN